MYMQNANGRSEVDNLDLFSLLNRGKILLFKWRKIIFTIYFLGILAGTIYYITKPKTYHSSLIASSNILKGSSFIIVIEGLQRHVAEGNFSQVAKALNISEETARKIKKLEVFSVRNFSKKQLGDKISEEDNNRDMIINDYIIDAYVNDNEMWPALEKGLLYYLNNNEFSVLKNSEKKESLKLLKEKIHSQISSMDTLANNLKHLYSNRQSQSTLMIANPGEVYNNIVQLYKVEVDTEIELREPVIYVIQGFVPFKKPYSPKLFATMLMALVLSTIITAIFIVYKENQ